MKYFTLLLLASIASEAGAATQVIDAASSGSLGLATGDFNGDGKLDFVAAAPASGLTEGNGRIYLFQGDGSGNFSKRQIARVAAYHNGGVAVAAADFEGNRVLDLVVASADGGLPGNNGKVYLLKNNGHGQFQVQQIATVDAYSGGGMAVAVGDFNDDKQLDILVGAAGGAILAGDNGEVTLLLNQGNGKFSAE